ncbi:MAG: HAD family hydrolase [Candidatus Aenigmarchaeota archaeon]|nr:HAD family hydrolase [Candidatus Aenigmarchaeota archaeon]
MPEIKAYITDDNGTRIPGYREIRLAYRVWRQSLFPNFNLRDFYEIGFQTQPKCWRLALDHKVQEAAETFVGEAMVGLTRDDVRYLARKVFLEDSHFYGALTRLPRAGKLMDTKPVPGSSATVCAAKTRGKKTGILSLGFEEFILGHIEHHGLTGYFDVILANRLAYLDGKVVGIARRIKEKGSGMEKVLSYLELPADGSAVAFVGDSELDVPGFKKVEYPVVVASAKPEFKERCRGDPDFGNRVFIAADGYQDIRVRFNLD